MSNNGGVYTWSKTAATNAGADSLVNWAEGQAPSSVNDSARAMMASVAKYRDDISGSIVTTGTSSAYAVSSNQIFDTLADFNGQVIAFSPHVTNAAGPVTITVDGFANLPLRTSPGKELLAGTIIQGTPYLATYNNSDGALYLQGYYPAPTTFNIPLAGGMDYWGSVVPNSSFAFPIGQAISRATYATLFAIMGTTYGVGDGSTTFNLPDKTGRVSAMQEGTATRLTSTYFGGNSTALGAVGGLQSNSVILTHNHTLTDPGHTHTTSFQALNLSDSGASGNTGGGGSKYETVTMSSATTGITIASAGSASAHNIVQPTIICNYIIRVL